MNENIKKERRANMTASLSSLVLLLFAQLQTIWKLEFFQTIPFPAVLILCITCIIASICAAYCLINISKRVKLVLFQLSATSCRASLVIFTNL